MRGKSWGGGKRRGEMIFSGGERGEESLPPPHPNPSSIPHPSPGGLLPPTNPSSSIPHQSLINPSSIPHRSLIDPPGVSFPPPSPLLPPRQPRLTVSARLLPLRAPRGPRGRLNAHWAAGPRVLPGRELHDHRSSIFVIIDLRDHRSSIGPRARNRGARGVLLTGRRAGTRATRAGEAGGGGG